MTRVKVKLSFTIIVMICISLFTVLSVQADDEVTDEDVLYLYYFETDDVLLYTRDAPDDIVGGAGTYIVNYTANYDADGGTYSENGTPGTTGITVVLPETTGVITTTGPANTPGQLDNLNGVEGVIGTSGNDTFASSLDSVIISSLGNDVIDGGTGNDYLYGLSTDAGIDFDGNGTAEIASTAGTASHARTHHSSKLPPRQRARLEGKLP